MDFDELVERLRFEAQNLGWYILDGHEPKKVSFEEFAAWKMADDEAYKQGQKSKCQVACTVIGPARISTVFLSLPPIGPRGTCDYFFETMIFGGPLDQEQFRYKTWSQAEAGHAVACGLVRQALAGAGEERSFVE